MRKILRTQKSAYALSLILVVVGVLALLATLWLLWPQLSTSENAFSTFLSLLWTEELSVIPGFSFKLLYLVILADVMIIVGVIVWLLSRQWLNIPGRTALFQCPFCHKKWRSTESGALVHCPHCRQLIHPKLAEK